MAKPVTTTRENKTVTEH